MSTKNELRETIDAICLKHFQSHVIDRHSLVNEIVAAVSPKVVVIGDSVTHGDLKRYGFGDDQFHVPNIVKPKREIRAQASKYFAEFGITV